MSELYLDKVGSVAFEITPAMGSPRATWWQNGLVNKSTTDPENCASPPLRATSERLNAARVPRLFPPLRLELSFSSPLTWPPTFLSFHSKWDFSSVRTSFAWWETFMSLHSFKHSCYFHLYPLWWCSTRLTQPVFLCWKNLFLFSFYFFIYLTIWITALI